MIYFSLATNWFLLVTNSYTTSCAVTCAVLASRHRQSAKILKATLASGFFLIFRFTFLFILLYDCLGDAFRTLCQALLYFPTVNKDKQINGHHQRGCKDKAFGPLLHLFYKGVPSIPKNFSVRSRLHLLGRQIHNQQYKNKKGDRRLSTLCHRYLQQCRNFSKFERNLRNEQ